MTPQTREATIPRGTTVTRGRGSGAGNPRRYASNAERQKAYRDRQRPANVIDLPRRFDWEQRERELGLRS